MQIFQNMTWFYLTILAVIFQTQRNLMQRNLRNKLGTIAVSWARIFFILPFLLISLGFLCVNNSDLFVKVDYVFYIFCFGAAIAQILGTLCLVELFSCRNFVVGVTYMKTDTLQVAILAAIFLSESVPTLGVIAISIAVIGIILLTPLSKLDENLKILNKIVHKSAILGLAVGLFLSFTTIFMKKAMNIAEIESGSKIMSVIVVLIIYTIMQNILYIAYESYRKNLKATFREIMLHWKKCSQIGVFSIAGTICWLGAFSLQLVAYVKVVAQLEILVSFFISHYLLKEKSSKYEVSGILLLVLSVILILFV